MGRREATPPACGGYRRGGRVRHYRVNAGKPVKYAPLGADNDEAGLRTVQRELGVI